MDSSGGVSYATMSVDTKYKLIEEQSKELEEMEKALAEVDSEEDEAASAQAGQSWRQAGGETARNSKCGAKMTNEAVRKTQKRN